ncbi:MAG: hypothetical protein A2509_05865 [Candidatus Edwardsbacteria bacterium RIFOXYD12_FULL_50_11]|nr:MAG: hypothetical protein A2502_10750 [Candidatus Edwardsbacteria bacterium RifOxyC12_full_54_24]OGF06693.1 MAG: hypothetical protein A2273_00315 [Candidatus Edwardsbacteria bacterium RifOxyA12_full_54_48]OGF10644.1 MAG: hypothetical protein A3K15_05680 [Candidatus Edwardsbacteria bacterium GWE2_54_12]OGF15426.1 MAG: hypothetical protein A2509_05865 [Candidatus Edwardsbacteria bacterium RIFOXYD12_FULL_50_11]OGJ18788.1 MAG: hypothetical protein A2349_07165 [Candidatus Edwardsbacteria bacteriu
MKKIIYILILSVMALPAMAGYYQMVDHLPNIGGVDDAAVSFYRDASVSKDGIAVIGGTMPGGATNMASHYTLDNSWTGLSLLPFSLIGAAATSVGDTVYCHGGWDSDGMRISNRLMKFARYIYDWDTLAGYSLTPRMNHGLVRMYGQYLYAVGGSLGASADSTVERLDIYGGPPIYVKAMPQGRRNAVVAGATGGDGNSHIYVIGGLSHTGALLNSVIEYDSSGYPGTWTVKTSMPGPARWQAAGAVVNNKIFVMGGIVDLSGTVTRRVDIYDPQANVWTLGDSLPEPLCRAGAAGYGNVIYIMGGFNANTSQQSDSVWAYHPFAPNPPPLANPPQDALVNNQIQDFYWHPVAGIGYMIQVTDDSTFSTISVVNSYAADTSTMGLSPYLTPEGKFYWRVKVYVPSDSSNWSPVRRLTLDMTPPDAPIPSTPADASILNTTSVNFSWFAVDGAVAYNLQVDNIDGSFTSPIINDSTISTAGVNIDLSAYGDYFYYWRVRARDAAGNWSGYYSIPTFTIDQTSPWVNYNEPYDGEISVAVGRVIVIGFSEPINYSTAGNFAFTCSPDPMGWFESWNITGDTVTLTHNDFAAGQSVSFTVTDAKDLAGNNQVSSYAWNFSTEDYDYTPPSITSVKCSTDPLYAGSPYSPFTVFANDDKKMGSVTVYWGTAGYNGYNFSRALNETSPGEYQTSINGNEIGMEGVQYQVEAMDSAGNVSYYPNMGDYYIHSVYMNGQVPATPFTYDKWQMISIPAYAIGSNIFGQISNLLGPYDNTKWRLFNWSGSGYHEITTATTISELGRAYWLNRRVGPSNITFPGAISSYGDFNQSKPCSLDLYTGWNDLGTPFMFDINWDNVYLEGFSLPTYSGSIAGPYYYDGIRWLLPTEVTANMSFASFQGFSFKNDLGSPTYLEIYPTSAKKKDGKTAVVKSPDGWQALVVVENQGGSDHNYFGLSADASIERDQYDYPEPPSGLTGTSGYFRLADDQFCTDIRPEIGEGQVWNFAVECNGQTKLAVNLPAEFPAGMECFLADLTRQVSVNIAGEKVYSFIPESSEQTREFRIIVGSGEYAKQVLGKTFSVPTATVLGQNLPNPFSGRTSISYQLAAEGRVKMSVYNVAGQLVRTLLDEHQMTGRYSVAWDGRDQAGRQVSAGLYFYQLQAPNRTETRRMALVR